MSVFDEDLFLKGLEQRKSTLGADYVEKNLAAADDFTRPFQEAMTAWLTLVRVMPIHLMILKQQLRSQRLPE